MRSKTGRACPRYSAVSAAKSGMVAVKKSASLPYFAVSCSTACMQGINQEMGSVWTSSNTSILSAMLWNLRSFPLLLL